MPDREKVIKDSEEAIDVLAKAEEPTFWLDFVRCAFENALSLLKEQEAVKPKIDAFGHPYCPKCKALVYQTWSFCPHCGQAVKWR